jgi:hypothetical protein
MEDERDLAIRNVAQLTAELSLVQSKLSGVADGFRAQSNELGDALAELATVKTNVEGVWKWQGEGDNPESLSCPVVMSAEALRGLLKAQPAAHECEPLSDAEIDALTDKEWFGEFPVRTRILCRSVLKAQREKCQKGRPVKVTT